MNIENAAFYICLQSGVPPLALGEPGTSKTRSTEAFAKAIGRHYECIIGSQREPGDIVGYPAVQEHHGRKVLSFVPCEWRIRLEESASGGIAHFDELVDCPPAIQAAMLQVLGDGIPNTWIGCTGNPTECATNGFDLSAPTINRLCCLQWQTPVATWQSGMLGGFDRINQNFPILPNDWEHLVPAMNALIVSFTTKTQPTLLQALPETEDKKSQPWPSIRSWTNAARVLAAASSVGANESVVNQLIAGCVGEAAAISFLNWRNTLDLPDPETLLADPTQYTPPQRGDQAHAALSAVIAAVLRNNTVDRWNSAWVIIERQCNKQPDIAAIVAGPLVEPKNKPSPECVVPKSIVQKLGPILRGLNAA